MKKILLSSLIAAAAAVPAIAGVNNLNYQAVIKNGNDVVANKTLPMRFELLNNEEEVVYIEEQVVKTNASGYVSCQLGNEEQLLKTIKWGDLTLRVSINFGNGSYEVVSNEEVSSVPSAIYALTSADSGEIREAVEELVQENEDLKSTVMALGADVAQIEGLAAQVEELETNTDAFATMLETRLDKMQNQADVADQNFANLGENLDNLVTEMTANFENVNGQLENLENFATVVQEEYATNESVEEFATMLETRLDKMQGQMDSTDQDFVNLGENLDNLVTEMNAKFDDVNGQLENLENFATVVKEEYATNESVEQFADMVGNLIDKVQKQVETLDDTLTPEVENLVQANEATQETILGINAELVKLNGVADDFAEFQDQYAEDWQSLAKFQEEISTDINEFKDKYAEDWQSLVKFQEEISTDINEFKDQYAEDWQSLSKFQEEISTDITEFKNQYAEDWQSLSTFQQEISTDITEFKNQYAEDWQSLSTFQQEISTEISEFKADYQESFQKMTEFQDGVTTSLAKQEKQIEQLEDAVNAIVNPTDPESIINRMSEQMAAMEEELLSKIAALEAEIKALKGE